MLTVEANTSFHLPEIRLHSTVINNSDHLLVKKNCFGFTFFKKVNELGNFLLKFIKTFGDDVFRFFLNFFELPYFLDIDIQDKCDITDVSIRTSNKVLFLVF